jgi:hypothetical protein
MAATAIEEIMSFIGALLMHGAVRLVGATIRLCVGKSTPSLPYSPHR